MTVSQLFKYIDRLTEFGTNPKIESENKIDELKKLLFKIHSEYLNIESDFDPKDFEDEPEFNFKEIRRNVKTNFPDFGLYHIFFHSHKTVPDGGLVIRDSINDLSDLIIDMLIIKWRFENKSEDEAIGHFQFIMRIHSEQHIVDLLKYLKDKNR